MRIGIISAMDSEHRQLAERLEEKQVISKDGFHYVEGRLGENHLILTQCGIGKVNAAIGASELIRRFHPDCVISTGVAGGIDARLRVTDVVVSDRLVYHDVYCGNDGTQYGQVQGLPLYFEACKPLVDHAVSLNGKGQLESTVHAGLICTGDQFIEDRQVLDGIKANFPDGMAVDMESCSIAHTCYVMNTPFVSFRIISDTPGAHDDNFSQYENFWGTVAERSFHTTWEFLSTLPGSL